MPTIPSTLTLFLTLSFVVIPAAVAESFFRASGNLPNPKTPWERQSSTAIWVAITSIPFLLTWGYWQRAWLAASTGGLETGQILWLLFWMLGAPGVVGWLLGRVFADGEFRRDLMGRGLVNGRNTTPWEDHIAVRDEKGIWLYFNVGGEKYLGASINIDHQATQILADQISELVDGEWKKMPEGTQAIVFPQAGTAMLFYQ